MLDFRITLEARNPARRCSRQYRVEAGTDLFGVWVVEISYGRIGTAGGRSRSYVVRDEEEARHLAQSILKRRASAPRRIGVAYRIRELIDPEGLTRISQMRSRNRHDSCAKTLRIPGFPRTSCPFDEPTSWVTAQPSRFDPNLTAGSASSGPRSPAMRDSRPTANSTTPSMFV
jgi:hypothetical protein